MGLEWAKVVPQTEPIRLELLGTTEYDSDNQTRIRPLFRGRVDRVYAKVGQLVTKGEPLIEFYSTDLAEAKNACEIERIQWVYSANLLGGQRRTCPRPMPCPVSRTWKHRMMR